MDENPQLEGPSIIPPSEVLSGADIKPAPPEFGIRMRYKGEDRTIELPLSPDMVGRLAIEAEFRNMRIGELVAKIIVGAVERDIFKPIVD